MNTAFEAYLTEIKCYYEEKMYENVDDLKTLINSSHSKLREIISSQKVNEFKTGLYRNYPRSSEQNVPNTFGSTKSGYFSRPLSLRSVSNLNSNYERRNNNSSLYQNSLWNSTTRSVHTPLAEIINHNNKISLANRNQRNKEESPIIVKEVKISSYSPPPKREFPRACKQNYTQRCTQLNFKRKIRTPNLQTKQSKRSANMKNSFLSNVKDSKMTPTRNRQLHVNTAKAETATSSPYLTLYEATMAEEFTFV
ncbi:uncharacterized protein LOC129987765 [Argiope bruennichi]|nr:uncharacterized protein LOC129987765 [Argiope bruennichi]